MIDKEAWLNVLGLHALTGLPIMIPDGGSKERPQSGMIYIRSDDTLIDPSRQGSWMLPVDALDVTLTQIERTRATILFTAAGGNIHHVEQRAHALRSHPEMGAWIERHDGERIRDASLRGDANELKDLFSQGAYPHAYDHQILYHAVKHADAALVDWILSHFPASGEIMDNRIHHGFHWAIDYVQNFDSHMKEKGAQHERRLLSLIEVLGRHQKLPKLSALMARNLMEAQSPDIVAAVLGQGALAILEPREALLVEQALLNAASVKTSDRYLEVLIDAGLDISCFPRAQSIRDRRSLDALIGLEAPRARPAIGRRDA